ncbi:flagellar motor protein MotB [soil metagenome]
MAASDQAIVIKKVKKVVGGGHHGGACKVAYADFVTAMMAFFLLMWLINTTSPEQKRGIADYFAPASVSETTSGSGGILGGTSLGDDGAKGDGSAAIIEDMAPEAPKDVKDSGQSSDKSGSTTSQASQEALKEAQQKAEEAALQNAAQSLRQAMQSMPELAELSKQVIVDVTPEGLRIQLVDQEGRPMFDNGSARPNARAQTLLRAVGKIVNKLPNRVTISGHTSIGANGRTNDNDWPLSQARADEARRTIQQVGVDADRIAAVNGKANAEPLYPDDPMLAGNRRIAIVLLREAPVLPPR